jgi:hypothetical protein
MPLPPAPVVPPVALPPAPVVPPVGVLPPAPLVPPVPDPPLPVVPPVEAPPVHTPLLHDWLAPQAWPQLPQLLVLDVVSTQTPPQSCWPATLQLHAPPVHEAPTPQAVQLAPQWPESLFELQAPSLHIVLPEGHDDVHWPLSQTWPVEQAAQLAPQ